jgi:uncharacterized membrane protein YdfJ with MMPL/SSD domain
MADAVTEGRYIRQNRPVISKQSSAPANKAALIEESPVVAEAPAEVVVEAPVEESPAAEIGLSDVAPDVAPDDAPELVDVESLEPVAEAALPVGEATPDAEASTESDGTTANA